MRSLSSKSIDQKKDKQTLIATKDLNNSINRIEAMESGKDGEEKDMTF